MIVDQPLVAGANEGLVDWLLSCPEKRYFVAVESDFALREWQLKRR
jgi:hypothetical protein